MFIHCLPTKHKVSCTDTKKCNKINTRHLEICAADFAKNEAAEAHTAWGNDWLAEDKPHRRKLSLGQATGQTKGKVKYLFERGKYSFIKLELILL